MCLLCTCVVILSKFSVKLTILVDLNESAYYKIYVLRYNDISINYQDKRGKLRLFLGLLPELNQLISP